MEEYDQDEMIMVEADFEIIKNLTNKVDLLDKNLYKLIINNNNFIESMEKIKTANTSNELDIQEYDNIEVIKTKLSGMKIDEIRKVCKNNAIKKYSNLNKSSLIDYICNNKDIVKLKL
jgi:hypothetical protein